MVADFWLIVSLPLRSRGRRHHASNMLTCRVFDFWGRPHEDTIYLIRDNDILIGDGTRIPLQNYCVKGSATVYCLPSCFRFKIRKVRPSYRVFEFRGEDSEDSINWPILTQHKLQKMISCLRILKYRRFVSAPSKIDT
jgi:hypothetical protein